jgi:hypothetical protein
MYSRVAEESFFSATFSFSSTGNAYGVWSIQGMRLPQLGRIME